MESESKFTQACNIEQVSRDRVLLQIKRGREVKGDEEEREAAH